MRRKRAGLDLSFLCLYCPGEGSAAPTGGQGGLEIKTSVAGKTCHFQRLSLKKKPGHPPAGQSLKPARFERKVRCVFVAKKRSPRHSVKFLNSKLQSNTWNLIAFVNQSEAKLCIFQKR